jgi:cell division septum initiation protein DivIVA
MSQEGTGSKAAAIAAQHVESIVAAAEESGTKLEEEARAKAEEIRAKARKDAEQELERARKKAVELDHDARRSASAKIEEAEKEAEQLREQTRRQIDGRVAAAEEAASQVLEEARTLSSGLRQLGSSLQSQSERILGDVQAAHKRMQADLRVNMPDIDAPARRIEATPRRRTSEVGSGPTATPEERAAIERAASELRESPRPRSRPRRSGDNPFDDLDVPSWVER